jgi:hypothetical protein
MRLAALYIPAGYFPYIFGPKHEEITINLGGTNLYNVQNAEHVTAVRNEFYIDDILDPHTALFSCIVGSNGSGKTTLLQLITEDQVSGIIEQEDGSYQLTDNLKPFHRVYYTPFLNSSNIGSVGDNGKELSKLALLRMDTHGDSGLLDDFLEVHASENSKRWIKFNHFYRQQQLGDVQLPSFAKVELTLGHFKPDIHNINAFHDTPWQLRAAIQLIFEKIKDEQEQRERGIGNRGEMSERDSDKMTSIIRFEYDLYETALGKFVNILERNGNRFLQEGFIPDNYEESMTPLNVRSALEYLLINAGVFGGNAQYSFSQHLLVLELVDYVLALLNLDSISEDNWRKIIISEEQALKIIELYDTWNHSFINGWFKLDTTPMFSFKPQLTPSSGEQQYLNLFSTLYYHALNLEAKADIDLHSYDSLQLLDNNILLLLDEGDNAFHPQWKKLYVKYLRQIVPIIFDKYQVQIIITSHDPLTLSDLPKNNVVFIDGNPTNRRISNSSEKKTFAANISDLLKDSFFIRDEQIGSYAAEVIDRVIGKIRAGASNETDLSYIERIIRAIDEPIIKFKLAEMLSEATGNSGLERQLLDEEIKKLQEKRNHL